MAEMQNFKSMSVINLEALDIGPVGTSSEMDLKFLKMQRKQLAYQLRTQQKTEADLRALIETLENELEQKNMTVATITRYWDQLNEDVRELFERFQGHNLEGISQSLLEMQLNKCAQDDKMQQKISETATFIKVALENTFARQQKYELYLMKKLSTDEMNKSYEKLMKDYEKLGVDLKHAQEGKRASDLAKTEVMSILVSKNEKITQLQQRIEDLELKIQRERTISEKLNDCNMGLKSKIKEYENQAIAAEVVKETTFSEEPTNSDNSTSSIIVNTLQDKLQQAADTLANITLEYQNFRQHQKTLTEEDVKSHSAYHQLVEKYSVLYNLHINLRERMQNLDTQIRKLPLDILKSVEEVEIREIQAQNCMKKVKILDMDVVCRVQEENNYLALQVETLLATKKMDESKISFMEKENLQLKNENSVLQTKLESAQGKLIKHNEDIEDSKIMKEVRLELKRAQNNMKEMSLLIEMFQGRIEEEGKTKAELLAIEKQMRQEIEKLNFKIKNQQINCSSHSEYEEKIKELELQNATLSQEAKVLDDAYILVSKQNELKTQDLKQLEQVNNQLVSSGLNREQVRRLLQEENKLLSEQVDMLTQLNLNLRQVNSTLGTKETILTHLLVKSLHGSENLRLNVEATTSHCLSQFDEIKHLEIDLDKCKSDQQEMKNAFTQQISQLSSDIVTKIKQNDEKDKLKVKVGEIEYLKLAVEALEEEVKQYKQALTCSSCKVKTIDTILTTCFHSFCYDCTIIRYKSRQRKCPTCLCGFGNGDFHKMFINI